MCSGTMPSFCCTCIDSIRFASIALLEAVLLQHKHAIYTIRFRGSAFSVQDVMSLDIGTTVIQTHLEVAGMHTIESVSDSDVCLPCIAST